MENLRRLKTVENTRNSKNIYASGGGTNIHILEEGTAKLSLVSGAQQNTFYKKSHDMKKENLNKLNEVRNTPVLHHADFDEVKMELMNELQKGRNTALSRHYYKYENLYDAAYQYESAEPAQQNQSLRSELRNANQTEAQLFQ